MKQTAPDRMDVVKKEDKEARLTAFVRKDLEQRRAGADTTGCGDYRLVLRSAESPVARALAGLASELSAAGIGLRVVLAQVSTDTIDADIQRIASFADGVRVVRDIRLLDAHEQLVLAPTTAWIGDCMRREPSKRDAYECYAENRADVAGWAATSFERMWLIGRPAGPIRAAIPTPVSEDDAMPAAMLAALDEVVPPEVATRH